MRVVGQLDRHARGAVCVLRRVLKRLHAREVDRGLDLRGVAADLRGVDDRRQRRAAARGPQRLGQPALGEEGRIDAAREGTHLVDRLVDLRLEVSDGVRADGRIGVEPLRDQLEPYAQRDQTLLSAVVEVALDSAALAVPDRDYPRSRSRELLERAAQTLDEAVVLERIQRIRRGSLDEGWILREARVMQDRGYPPPVGAHLGNRTPICGLRRLYRPTCLIDPMARVAAQPVHDLERGVLQRIGERGAQIAGARVRPEKTGEAL